MYNIDGVRKPIGRPRQQMLMGLNRHAHYDFIDAVKTEQNLQLKIIKIGKFAISIILISSVTLTIFIW